MREQNRGARGNPNPEPTLAVSDRTGPGLVCIVERAGYRRQAALPAWNARLSARMKKAARGCNLREIAHRTQANSETVRRYLRDGNPGVRFLARFCDEFRVSADWLLRGLHGSTSRRNGRPSPIPETKVRVTLALSKGRVRVVSQGQPRPAGVSKETPDQKRRRADPGVCDITVNHTAIPPRGDAPKPAAPGPA